MCLLVEAGSRKPSVCLPSVGITDTGLHPVFVVVVVVASFVLCDLRI